jgi:hypothetical protein
MSKIQQTVSSQATSAAAGTRRRTRGSRLMALALATIATSSALFAAPHAAQAAANIGPYGAASVTCNTVQHTMTITPLAGAADGLASQQIAYHYWLLDRTVNRYVAGWNPTRYGTILHQYQYEVPIIIWGGTSTITVPGPIYGAADEVTLTAGHSYSVYTEYWWPTGGHWYSAGIWTPTYTSRGYAWQLGSVVPNMCQV